MIGPETVDSYIKNAQALGALSASAVWALVCGYQMIQTWRRDNRDEKIIEVRLRSAEASIKNAEAIEQVSEKMVQLMIVNSELASIIRELNRRIKCLGG